MILDEILTHKRGEVAARRSEVPLAQLQEFAAQQAPARPFGDALRGGDVRVIAEVKRRSPSKGTLAPELDPARMAGTYADFGAAAISVLTDEKFFGGSLDDLAAVRREVSLPLLRKDFILGEYQVLETRAYGADAVLLIAGVLDRDDLARLIEYSCLLGMDALVEVHTEEDLDLALGSAAPIIGINNRDLTTFQTNLETTCKLAPLVPPEHVLVSESGIHTREQMESLGKLGVNAVLVGEALVSARSAAEKLRELVGE